MKIKWGIIGTAKITNRLIPAIQESQVGELEAISSRDITKAKKMAEDHNINKYYGTYEELLQDKEIQVVYIPLPNHLHKKWTIEAAKHRKHVVCEKPFALTRKEAEEMFKAGEENQVKIMEAFMYRFNPKIERIKSILQKGTLGTIKNIDFNFSHTLEEILTQENNYRIRAQEGGGALYDLGVYGINTINCLLGGEPEKILCCNAIKKDDQDIDRALYTQLLYKDQKIATITASFQSYGNYLMVSGTKGILEVTKIVSQGAGELRINTLDIPDTVKEEMPAFNSYKAMVDHFNACILENKEPQVTKEQTLGTMKVVDELLSKMEKIN